MLKEIYLTDICNVSYDDSLTEKCLVLWWEGIHL